MKTKLYKKMNEKVFGQTINFFAILYMALATVWISADYFLAFLDKSPVGELSETLATGIPIVIVGTVVGKRFDHWLQDHYGVDKNGNPRKK